MDKAASIQLCDIRDIAQATREAIKRLVNSNDQSCENIRSILSNDTNHSNVDFPNKWCKFASNALGRRIARLTGHTEIALCKWEKDNSTADHWWLRIDDADVDITADQFDFTSNTVIVNKQSQIHKQHFIPTTCSPFFAQPLMNLCFELATASLDHAISKDKECSAFDIAFAHLRQQNLQGHCYDQ